MSNQSLEPLAMRMRPTKIDEIVGQSHILSPNSLLTKMIRDDMLSSIILYGPPGTGKTTIAQVIAQTTNAKFEQLNAVAAGKKDIERVCDIAQKAINNTRTILFIDEIHRFNKAQQDYLLPFVERGVITLIGATTENPFFEVNPALVSRSILFELQPIQPDDIKKLINRALTDTEKGLGNKNLTITPEGLTLLADQSNGDVRHALSLLELAALKAEDNNSIIDEIIIKDLIQKPHLRYDKDGDMHYDTISAFIKSMRGSDPDAVLYYLARLIESGEDPKFIARRIIIAASEDVGNADPMALIVATNASLAVERIGMPEGRIILSQAALYIAMAPKSNTAYIGIDEALDYVKNHPTNDIPNTMKDCHYKSAKKLGHGTDYIYPHDATLHWVPQQYLPDSVINDPSMPCFYKNSHIGYEETQADYQNSIHMTYYRNNGL